MIKNLLLTLGLCGCSVLGWSQSIGNTIDFDEPLFQLSELPEIDEELSRNFFMLNRERLRDTMKDSAVAVIFSASQKARANDIDYPFHQDADFFYFTGIREPNAMLMVFKEPMWINDQWMREILFIEERDSKKEQWTGKMLGQEGAEEISGAALVLSNTDFKPMIFPWEKIEHVYTNQFETIERDNREHPGDLMSMVKHLENKTAKAGLEIKSNEGEDLFAQLRQQKSTEEINMLRRAIDITCIAQQNAMVGIKPGMTEYQVEAIIEYTFRTNGADGEAFSSIVASGRNGAIMHYTANESLLIPGDLVIMDIGAQYQGYAADVTRTVPVSGRFTEEQAAIYKVVLDAQTVAIRYATPGYKFWTPHEEAYRTIGKGLIKLGVIKEWSEIGNYFIHGTSHYLGLDVHDAGVYSSLKPGEVITVEPGVYIPEGSPCDPKWWNIYVRIEDDLLITNGPAEVLSDCVPKSISEIEAIMNGEQASVEPAQ